MVRRVARRGRFDTPVTLGLSMRASYLTSGHRLQMLPILLIDFRRQEHVQCHLQAPNNDKTQNNPHPQSILTFTPVQDLQHHLEDVHCNNIAKTLISFRADLQRRSSQLALARLLPLARADNPQIAPEAHFSKPYSSPRCS